jgi:hypothetical protein
MNMLNSRTKPLLVAALLTLAGGIGMLVRVNLSETAKPSEGESDWRVTLELTLKKLKSGSRFRLSLPIANSQQRISQQSFQHPGLVADIIYNRTNGSSEAAMAAITNQEDARFRAVFDIHLLREPDPLPNVKKLLLGTPQRTRYLRAEDLVQTKDPIVGQVLETLRNQVGKNSLVELAVEYCHERLKDDPNGPRDAAGVLRSGRAGPLGRVRALLALCRAANVPARLVTGFVVEEKGPLKPRSWVEVYLKRHWRPCDPVKGYALSTPPSYVALKRDGLKIYTAPENASVSAHFTAERLERQSEIGTLHSRSPWQIVDLRHLSPGMQSTMGTLLLLPLGALLTSLFRNMVGLPTFGTFTPCLLALSFAYADWRTGLVVFVAILGTGLYGRRVIDQLKLLMVSRLGLLLTLVVLSMTLAISALDYWGLTPSARAALLPMVIMTMMIERFHIACEEDGFRNGCRVFAGTLFVAACCMALMVWESLGAMALRFPEAQLFVAAGLILTGRYTGYRLSELARFRGLANPETLT